MSLLQSVFGRKAKISIDRCAVVGESHVGHMRPHNEDCYLYVRHHAENAILLGVADGMGGHEGGEVASYMTMHYMLNEWNHRNGKGFSSKEEIREFLQKALRGANEHVYHVNNKLDIHWPMGTTATVGVVWEQRMVISHVGDSRCYCFRRNKLFQLTSDQTLITEMIRKGGMSPADAALHPLSHTLTNCIGTQEHLEIDFKLQTVMTGDRYIFCSDGLSSMVSPKDLCRAGFEADAPDTAVKEMIQLALDGGGTDNITAVSLFVK
jgi:protein phosphatase